MLKKKRIPDKLYRQILKSVPISTVDLVVIDKPNKNNKFLLGKRKNNPYKGKWFIPGGRVLLGETLEEAVQRNLKQELGLHSKKIKFLFHYYINNPPAEVGVKYYTILHVYMVQTETGAVVKKDEENIELAWFDKINENWPKPVKEILKIAGFR